ncbi:MAG: calcium-binding protein [Solirubrobacteraceae bacterium]
MPARNGVRRRFSVLPIVFLITAVLPIASAAAALPRTYKATRIDSPTPVGGGAFGWGVWSADLTGDGKQDLLVAQAQIGTAAEPNKVFIYNGVTGALVDTITPPEDNPPGPGGAYQSPEMAFVYIETMPDLGSCAGGDGPDADRICDLPLIGPEDGIPEIVVGSRALRVNPTDGNVPATLADPRPGRGYVIDGATRAVLKRIDMPAADRQALLARSGANSVAAFGRTMSSPQGMPPCFGLSRENNDAGVGPCPPISTGTGNTTSGSPTLTNVDLPDAEFGQMVVGPGIPLGAKIASGAGTATVTLTANATATASGVSLTASDPRYPQAVRIGDLDGGGKPDLVITARGFPETRGPAGSAATGSECKLNTTPGGVCGAGKVWTYRGEDIAGTNPQTTLDTALYSIQNPDAQTTGGEYGGNLWRVGDLVADDGIPDYVIPFRGADLPLKAPDLNGGLNMGAAHLFSGRTGVLSRTIVSPEPQIRSEFSGNFNAGRAFGDLGATTTPDILLPAPFQNVDFADEGRNWVFNGDLTAGGGGEQSWNFAMLNDPEPYIGGNFGGGLTGIGDVVTGPGSPANEVIAGGFRFDNFTEASQNIVPDVNFMNVTLDKNLMTIPHPEGKTGDGFGVGITPMGDLNGDGFLDFSVSSYFADGPLGGQGRAWIFKSDNSPLPAKPTKPATTVTVPKTLQPGRCANRTVGTDAAETLKGTIAGDEMFGFAGNDIVSGFQDRDCLDGGTGNDKLDGGDDSDRVIGGHGRDRLDGGPGADRLFGGSSNDLLFGRSGRDMLAGGSANDRLSGGSGDDQLFGEAGRDSISGGSGRNRIDGGTGNDRIDARNGKRDRVICGKGFDRVRADRSDRLNGCERVTYGGKIK